MSLLLASGLAACDTVEGVSDWFGFDAPEDRAVATEAPAMASYPNQYGNTGGQYPSIPGDPYVAPGQQQIQQLPPQQAYSQPQYGQQPAYQQQPVQQQYYGQQQQPVQQIAPQGYQGAEYASPQTAYAPDANPVYAGAASALQADLTNIAGDRIFFPGGAASLDPKAHEVLVRQADWLRRRPNVTATLIGHADDRGNETQNLLMGQKRADVARNYLIQLGINADRLTAVSFGSRQPYARDKSSSARALNRRVVMVVNPG